MLASLSGDRTILLFGLRNTPGSLAEALASLHTHGVNTSSIHSSGRQTSGECDFICEVDGHEDDEDMGKALADLRATASFVKVVGSYAKGQAAAALSPRRVD